MPLLPARFQRPFPFNIRKSVLFVVPCQVQYQAVGVISAFWLAAQATAHHLQVQRKAHCRAGKDYARGVREVKALGGYRNVY